jgi:hypothetical protein
VRYGVTWYVTLTWTLTVMVPGDRGVENALFMAADPVAVAKPNG